MSIYARSFFFFFWHLTSNYGPSLHLHLCKSGQKQQVQNINIPWDPNNDTVVCKLSRAVIVYHVWNDCAEVAVSLILLSFGKGGKKRDTLKHPFFQRCFVLTGNAEEWNRHLRRHPCLLKTIKMWPGEALFSWTRRGEQLMRPSPRFSANHSAALALYIALTALLILM